ncbi:hypothetical protein [Geoalkalibacter sp.]|uniref:hypothetical protein n=1 Tax=Geoalkalibacter sp. TaxID=3041440 RepID=UPI00272ED890|nr:hypothetical protein [Geoalkalibacter sp.]
MKLFGKKVIDWGKMQEIPEGERAGKACEAVAHAMKMVAESPLQKMSPADVLGTKMRGSDGNLVHSAPPIVLVGDDTVDSPDRGYEALFTEVDMRTSTQKTFEIMDVTGGVTFYQQIEGESAKLSKLPTAAKVAVQLLRFTGGFAILDDWLRFNEFYKIDELTDNTVRRWYDQKANLFWGLIESLSSGINQAFQTDDVTTINNAAAKIVTDLEAAGYPVSGAPGMYIVCHPNLLMRIYKALAASFINPNANNNQIVWPIRGVIPTTKVSASHYYVALPGLKSRRGEWQDLTTRPAQRNELVLGADHVWTGAYNGALAESKQFRRCALT